MSPASALGLTMPLRNFLIRCRLLLPHGGGSTRALTRTLSYTSSPDPYRPPPSVSPPRFHPGGTFPPPPPTAPRGDAAASATWPPTPRPYNPMASYLARACGFSYEEATAAAELLAGNKSPTNPNPSARRGTAKSPLETQMGWLVSSAPPPPGCKLGAAADAGFSGRTLAQLMLLDPGVLTGADATRKVGFWCALFRAEADLLRALESNTRSPGSSPKETTVRKMILLLECGVPNRELREVLRKDSDDVARIVDSLEALIRRVEELGLACGREAAYRYAVGAVAALSRRKLEARLGEHKAPQAVGNAFGFPKGLRKKKNAGRGMEDLPPGDGASPSIPLSLSLEKKVMPPYYILQLLRSFSRRDSSGEDRASYVLGMCKKARLWTNSHAAMNREFQSFMKLVSLLVRGRIAA